MNLNRLFPRLSIRAKLVIAFVLLAVVPVAAVAMLGIQYAVRQARAFAMITLEHDVGVARDQTARILGNVEADVAFLQDHGLGQLVSEPSVELRRRAVTTIPTLLAHRPALFQVKVVSADGGLLLLARASGAEWYERPALEGTFYALRAAALEPGQTLLLPVEIRDDTVEPATGIPALAILRPVRDTDGTLLGVVVGEALASELFVEIETASPQLEGVTGLIDVEGHVLYHSERKRDWASLLATRVDIELENELSPEVAGAMLQTDATRTLQTMDDRIVSFLQIPMASAGRELILYRIVPLSALEAGVRSFVRWATIGGAMVLALVLGLAGMAAHQFTQPIYQLREGARRLAGGEAYRPMAIETSDELEDLARDFSAMAEIITQRRQELEAMVDARTRALREAHAELQGILQHSADAIIGVDTKGLVRVWNEGAEELFGYGTDQAQGRDVDDLLLPQGDSWQAEAAFLWSDVADRGAVSNYQTHRTDAEGTTFPVSLTLTVIQDDKGHPLGYSLIIRDITMQTRLDVQLRRSERLAALSVLAAGLAHELGNPLAVISNRIECMQEEIRDREPGGSMEKDLEVLDQHATRIHELIRDFLSFAREEEADAGPIRLNELVVRVASLLDRTVRSRGVELEIDMEETVPVVPGSEKAIETVCMNLLLNALDATDRAGKVTISTRYQSQLESIELSVRDTGSGIPDEHHRRIFEPFFTTKTAGKGTGLGLAVCASIVERHGGSISVESQVDVGSRFKVVLPVRKQASQWMELEYS